MITRLIKASIVGSIALFFSLVVFNNVTDFESNRIYIEKVFLMDTVQNKTVAWRSLNNKNLHLTLYVIIILWEMVTAIICWLGTYAIFKSLKRPLCFYYRA